MDLNKDIKIPRHIGFILDGNRRWARQHSLPEFDGHLAGYNSLKEVIKAGFEQGVKFISIYAFSTENWQRDKGEVSNLMRLVLTAVTSDLKDLVKNQVKVRFLGSKEGLTGKILKAIEKAEDTTSHFNRGTLGVCFNYGGQQEILDATKQCIRDGLKENEITEAAIAERLYAPEIPPIDIIIRTSGEQRLSNFMLWRAAYSELCFLNKYWPDMTKDDVTDIIKEYSRRSRRFGV